VTLWLLLLALAQTPCDVGGKGAQCVTCTGNERGTVVCRGVCYIRRPDGGIDSRPLQGEANAEPDARAKVDVQAREKCP
jgi:hypothetical protein